MLRYHEFMRVPSYGIINPTLAGTGFIAVRPNPQTAPPPPPPPPGYFTKSLQFLLESRVLLHRSFVLSLIMGYMGCLKTNSAGTGRKCSSPAQLFFFDTFCPPHFCLDGQRKSGRDYFFVRRLLFPLKAEFTDL